MGCLPGATSFEEIAEVKPVRQCPTSKRVILKYWLAHPVPGGWASREPIDAHTCFVCGFEGSMVRHHVTPHVFSQCDDPSNLQLICRECHRASPHTPYPDLYWVWAKSQLSYMVRHLAAARRGIAASEMTAAEIEFFGRVLTPTMIESAVRQLRFVWHKNVIDTVVPTAIAFMVRQAREGSLVVDSIKKPAPPPDDDELDDRTPHQRKMQEAVDRAAESAREYEHAQLAIEEAERSHQEQTIRRTLREWVEEHGELDRRVSYSEATAFAAVLTAFRE
jgi:hypothetical protein